MYTLKVVAKTTSVSSNKGGPSIGLRVDLSPEVEEAIGAGGFLRQGEVILSLSKRVYEGPEDKEGTPISMRKLVGRVGRLSVGEGNVSFRVALDSVTDVGELAVYKFSEVGALLVQRGGRMNE